MLLIGEMPYLDLKDICGRTALYIASKRNHFEIAKVKNKQALIEAKANIYLKNLSGFLPFDVARSEKLKCLFMNLAISKKRYK